MKKKILIIGFGSIGQKHARILNKSNDISKIFILTKQKCSKYLKITKPDEILKADPDYILICCHTKDHLKHLKYLESNFSKKIILVEKPLFESSKNFKIKNNKVFVGYNLRYHPIIQYIKKFLVGKKVISINISCHSYLPSWRKNINYSLSNSAKKSYGGGALLELSHEIDYIQWIYKKINKIKYVRIKKLSKLKIDTEDSVIIVGKIGQANFIMDLNFFSLNAERLITINGENFTIKGDLINNTLQISKGNKKKLLSFTINKDHTYKLQHEHLLKKKYQHSCTFIEGSNLMKLLDKIRGLNE